MKLFEMYYNYMNYHKNYVNTIIYNVYFINNINTEHVALRLTPRSLIQFEKKLGRIPLSVLQCVPNNYSIALRNSIVTPLNDLNQARQACVYKHVLCCVRNFLLKDTKFDQDLFMFSCNGCGQETNPIYVTELEERMEEEMDSIKDRDLIEYQVEYVSCASAQAFHKPGISSPR